jgi:tetratricopeptide (TPR) repeat protein
MDRAFEHYKRALTIEPRHRGAHEYIGEAYLMIGDKAKAREHLAALERLCGRDCEEYRDLARAIAAAK